MFNENTFKQTLELLGFMKSGAEYKKEFPQYGCSLSVNFRTKKLNYPEIIQGGNRNNNFDAPENYVVFECVNRLLEKGYRPEHIELEKQWHLGHDSKSGRADICVTDETGSMLFIIECKTWGREFDKALRDTKNDGAQLFSYWQQEQSCKWLVLYASDLKDNEIEYKSPTISCIDDANIVLLAKKDKSIKLYRDSHTAQERYETWKEIYSCKIHNDLIFSTDSVAYKIGVKPLLKKNLRDFTPDDKIVNLFEEILRHNNVSDKENAFNRLIALFICKIVDESTKSEDDEVEFQYKQGTDTYETLQDRLQRLHRDGMEKFMREEIFYVSADYPEWLFSTYTGSKRKKAIEDLQNTIRILKFYSNNDFAFKDVHNEELFYQNGRILVEMVQLFEKYRIVYPSKHQFLGDLFEQLLNKGFKQNEGQFFTPTPITRFVWDSLPIENMISSERGTVYPKVIDYACGAGHFLTEAIEAINYFVKGKDNNAWVRDNIYGIEKDYRLARVAKISLFMNGAGEGNIIFGDGLENVPDKGINNGLFDILVANPPYSVKDFKQHLQLKNNNLILLSRIGLSGGEIETLFVERISQLLKPKGIAAVILPSSILSNDSSSYIGAREEILRNFYIRAIVSLGSKTFGATGTNTVIMFLEKFNEPPKQRDLAEDSIDAIFCNDSLLEWQDNEILEAYVKQIETSIESYKCFLRREYSLNDMAKHEYFKMYVEAFSVSPEAKKLQNSKTYKKKSKQEQNEILLERFYDYSQGIEKEKMFYFAFVYRQKTVLITSPSDVKGQKSFLGYEWSNRKGSEGIKIKTPGGKMYDSNDRTAKGTLASAIRQSFDDIVPVFTKKQESFGAVVMTKDMLDFSRATFKKAIRISNTKRIKFESKYPLKEIGDLLTLEYGKSLTEEERIEGEYPVMGSNGQVGTHNTFLAEGPTVIVGRKGSAGSVTWEDRNCYPIDTTYYVVLKDNSLQLKYIYYLLKQIDTNDLVDRMGVPGLNRENVYKIKVPVPPLKIQNDIIRECNKIDLAYDTTRMSIDDYKRKIEKLFHDLEVSTQAGGGHRLTLGDNNKFDVFIGSRVLNDQLIPDGNIPVYSANVNVPFGYINELLITDFSSPSVLWGIDGEWMTNYIPSEVEFYPTDHCGVLRCKTPEVAPRYMVYLLENEGKKMGFSRSYRASIDRVQGISFLAPSRSAQDDFISKAEEYEKKITEANSILRGLDGKLKEIVKTYLA